MQKTADLADEAEIGSSHADVQVLSALNADEARKRIDALERRGWEHYQTLQGHWDDEGHFFALGMTLFFRKRKVLVEGAMVAVDALPPGRGKGVRPNRETRNG